MNNPKKKIYWLVLLGGLSVLATQTFGQTPNYTPPPPPNKNVAFELRLRYLVAPDISFKGLGSVPLGNSLESPGGLLAGGDRFIQYDDGYLRQDYVEATLVGGGIDGSERVPSSNTAATSNFGYESASQIDSSGESEALLFHRYSSVGDPNAELAGSANGSLGWELNYTKYINRKRNLGIQVGFSFNGFDSDFKGNPEADLYEYESRHEMADGAEVPRTEEVTNDDGTVTQDPYVGDVVHEEGEPPDLLEFEREESQEITPGGAVVNSSADLRSSVYNFRAGPTYNLSLGQSFAMQVGLGVSAVYFDGRFSAFEVLENPGEGEDPSRGLTTTEDSEWQVGGYVDASAYYYFSDRISLFSGLQVQSGSSYTQRNEEREVSVDFSSQIYVHAGLGIRF